MTLEINKTKEDQVGMGKLSTNSVGGYSKDELDKYKTRQLDIFFKETIILQF